MSKRFKFFPFLILMFFLLLLSPAIWFAIGMSPGGNFSETGSTIEVSPSPQEIEDSILHETLIQYAHELNKMEIDNLKSITTKEGFVSLLSWSDSLQNKDFVTDLSYKLSHFEVFNIVESDSSITMSLGESHAVLGATGGYLFLKKEDNELKIDLFRGGK